jgi:hypothetical protein
LSENKKNEFDDILSECGFDYGTTSKISYQHFKKYLERAKKLEGWDETRFLISLRISIGIDMRYIKDIHEGFKELGMIGLNKGCIEFIGLKKQNNGKEKRKPKQEPKEEKEESITEYAKKNPNNAEKEVIKDGKN